jgi:hypothetical protein
MEEAKQQGDKRPSLPMEWYQQLVESDGSSSSSPFERRRCRIRLLSALLRPGETVLILGARRLVRRRPRPTHRSAENSGISRLPAPPACCVARLQPPTTRQSTPRTNRARVKPKWRVSKPPHLSRRSHNSRMNQRQSSAFLVRCLRDTRPKCCSPHLAMGSVNSSVSAECFLHRFLQHVLPRGFQRVRYFGWLSRP